MTSINVEQIIDELIGEAVLSLLHEKGPINTEALLQRLQVMQANEMDITRRELITRVIAAMGDNNLALLHHQHTPENHQWSSANKDNEENVLPLFFDEKDSKTGRKH